LRGVKSGVLALAVLAALLGGCGSSGGADSATALSAQCSAAWRLVGQVQAGLEHAAGAHVDGDGELPRADIEKIGEPAGEAGAHWTAAAEAARGAGHAQLASEAAHAASIYGEVQYNLSPEGGGYEATKKILAQAAGADAAVSRAAREAGVHACIGPAG
jgi:hypothetical protein